jgi:hypothetical protein
VVARGGHVATAEQARGLIEYRGPDRKPKSRV